MAADTKAKTSVKPKNEMNKPQELANSINSMDIIATRLRDLSAKINKGDARQAEGTGYDLDNLCSLLDNGSEMLSNTREECLRLISEIDQLLFDKSLKCN